MDFFRHRRSPGRPPHPDVLTPGEWRVLEELRAGRSNAEIAVRLGVSVNTVRTHVSRILAKLELPNRRELAQWDGEPAAVTREAGGRFRFGATLFGWLSAKGAGIAVGVVATVVLGVALAVGLPLVMADDGDGAEPMASGVAAPSATPLPLATPVSAITPVAPPTPPDVTPEHLVWIVDPEAGTYVEVYRGEDGRVHHWQRLAPDGTGFWVGRFSQGDSVRFGWDGQVQEVAAAVPFGVVESADGRSRAYALDSVVRYPVVVERDGARFEVDAAVFLAVFSADGQRLAFVQLGGEDEGLRLMLLDLATGAERELARGLGPCRCDGGPRPMWSPSGRYVVYVDFPDQPDGGRPDGGRPDGGREVAYLLIEAATGDVRELPGSPYRFGWESDADILAVEPGGHFELGERPRESTVLFIDAASGAVLREEHVVHEPGPTNAHRSPDGRWIALVRSHTVVPERAGEWPVDHWSLSVIDTESGVEVLIGEGQFEFPAGGSPSVAWNDAGTHFVFFTSPDL